jgi:hypothetical protein
VSTRLQSLPQTMSKQILFINSEIILLEERSDCYNAAHSRMFIIIFIPIHASISDGCSAAAIAETLSEVEQCSTSSDSRNTGAAIVAIVALRSRSLNAPSDSNKLTKTLTLRELQCIDVSTFYI